MKPNEKAKYLVELFWTEVEDNKYITRKMSKLQAKQCALIAVDEILKAGKQPIVSEYFDDIYWSDVKKEIENL